MSSFRIRPSRPDDLVAIDAVLSRAYPRLLKGAYPASVLVTAVPLIARAQPGLVGSGTYYVAENDNGTILGAGGWSMQDPGTSSVDVDLGHVRHVATDPDHLRKGVGAALMRHCLTTAWEFGMRRMQVISTLNAVPFYRACGFSDPHPVTIDLRPGIAFPAVRLMRDLD